MYLCLWEAILCNLIFQIIFSLFVSTIDDYNSLDFPIENQNEDSVVGMQALSLFIRHHSGRKCASQRHRKQTGRNAPLADIPLSADALSGILQDSLYYGH